MSGPWEKYQSDGPWKKYQKAGPDDFDKRVKAAGGTTGEFLPDFLAGAGKAVSDLYYGGRQLLGVGDQARVDEARKLDVPLMESGAGLAGNVAGNLVPALAPVLAPARVAQGLNTVRGAMATGAALGGMTPTTTDESTAGRLWNMGTGMALGGAAQGVGNAVSRALRPVQSTQTPETQRLLAQALQEGIPLDAAAQTGSKPLQIINSVMENLPFTAGAEAAKKDATQRAFNRAVLNRAGIAGDSAAPDVLAQQRGALGNQFEQIAGRNTLDLNAINQQLDDVVNRAGRRLTPDQAGVIARAVEDIRSQAQNGVLPGTNYQGWRSELGRMSRSNDTQGHFAGELKRTLDNAFNAQVPAADAQAWREASRQYGNLKTISNAAGGPGVAGTQGNVAPSQLAAALRNQVGKEGNAMGRGELNDLARIGQAFVKDNVPNSGTAQRAFYQSLLSGGVGLGGGLASGGDPYEALMYGAAGLAGPRAAQMLLNSGAGQRYLTQGVTNQTAQALAQALRAGLPATAYAGLLTNAQQ